MHVAGRSSEAPGGYRRQPAGRLKERTMDIQVLIRDLQRILDEADVALDAGNVDDARVHLSEAKKLLDDEFVAD